MAEHYRYLIIGGGMTGSAAIEGIRQVDENGSIGLFGAETEHPYNRPLLSKGLWKGKPFEKIWRKVDFPGLDLHLGRRIAAVEPGQKRVEDDQGEEVTYDKLLFATGGTPRRLPFAGEDLIYYRTLEDYQRLRDLASQGRRFAVIGGGFIGSEIAAALAMNGQKVTMVFPEEGIGARVYPADLARFLNDYYREQGVEVLPGEVISGMEPRGGEYALLTLSGKEILVDSIVAGIGIRPNTELAEKTGLDVDNGIVVDETLQTSHADIYAAGDVASFYNPALGKRLRVEHEDNANTMGRIAGQNMAGQQVPYHYLPFFYSDLFDLGYEAVGELNSELDIIADWQEPFHKGILYYMEDGRVRGVLLWNVWDQVDPARKLIAEEGPFEAEDLKQRLPV